MRVVGEAHRLCVNRATGHQRYGRQECDTSKVLHFCESPEGSLSRLFERYKRGDQVIETMRQTGRDMPASYKETALAGLAVNLINC